MFLKAGGENIAIEGRWIRVARIDGEKWRFVNDPEAVVKDLRKATPSIDLFTFLQRLPDTHPKYEYPMEWDNFATLAITTFDDWWNTQIGSKTRNMVRLAEKRHVSVREVAFDNSLVEGIYNVYNETPVRQGRTFPHYGKSLDLVRAEAATFLDCSIFIGAFFENSLIGFVKLTRDEGGQQAGLMSIISMMKHRDKAPNNALLAEAIRACCDRKIPYLVYSNFSYGRKKRDSLADFKEHNGFRKVEIPRYYVPLSWRGSMALRLGLHHRLAERVPEAFASRLRRLRNVYYSRKYAVMNNP
jgi:hypothetical protein